MVRRGNLFDESKIIKKNDIDHNETVRIEQPEQPVTQEKPISINNIVQESKPTESRTEVKEQNDEVVIQQSIIKNDFPVFNVQQNKYTGKIESNNIPKKCNIKIDIPRDQLQLINVNNNKYINEINLELAILDSLLLNKIDDNFEFYKNKYEYLSKELIFLNEKKYVISKLLK